jgi:hypothetical protein
MKLAVATAMLACVIVSTAAFAQTADDRRWVNQCLRDNSDAKVAASIVRAYCECMNNKMDDNETRRSHNGSAPIRRPSAHASVSPAGTERRDVISVARCILRSIDSASPFQTG